VRSEFTIAKDASGHIKESQSEYDENIVATIPELSQYTSKDEGRKGTV